MSTLDFGIDRLLYPVVIDANNNTIAWKEASTNLSTTITAGTYYCHTQTISAYPSLYDAITNAMNAESTANGEGYTYTIAVATPSLSIQQVFRGIKITSTGGTDWAWRDVTTSPATSYPGVCECLGFHGDTSDEVSANSSGVVYGRYMPAGVWVNPFDVEATSKDAPPSGIVSFSTEYTERDDFYALDRGERKVRELVYEYVQASHVRTARANDPVHAETGQVAWKDDHNALELLWRQARLGKTLIAVYFPYGTTPDLEVTTNSYEYVRLANVEAAQDMSALVSTRRMGGEYYDVRIPLSIISGTYTY